MLLFCLHKHLEGNLRFLCLIENGITIIVASSFSGDFASET